VTLAVPPAPSRSTTPSSPTIGIPPKRRTRGFEVIRWIEAHCYFTNGEWIGRPFRLLPWQKRLILGLFEIDIATELRAHRWAYISTPKKNGKTELAAALALYLTIADGEPSPLVIVAAASDRQANLIFGAARKMCELSPTLGAVTTQWSTEITVRDSPGARLVRVAAVAGTNDGQNIHAAFLDELHEWTGERGRKVWEVLTNGSGSRRQPLVVQTTTAGFDRESVCFEQYEVARGVLTGATPDPSYYAYIVEAPKGADWKDPRVWAEANPSFGTTVFEPYLEDQSRRKREATFRRYFLNQWTDTAQAWLPYGSWDRLADPGRKFDPAAPFVAFLDGSWSDDSTGIVASTIDRPHLSVLGHWLPDPRLEHVDMDAIERRAREVLAMPGIVEFAFDPARFQDLFARLEAEFNINDRELIVKYPWTLSRVVPACKEFETEVLRGRDALTHDGDPRLAAHIGNAVVKDDSHGPRIQKESKSSPRKIDLAVAAVGARDRARWHGVNAEPRSIYEREGVGVAFVDWED
jgi:phage terminase large subunit-like protein